jgi:hypothetical protein
MYSRWRVPIVAKNAIVYTDRMPPQNRIEPSSEAHRLTIVK